VAAAIQLKEVQDAAQQLDIELDTVGVPDGESIGAAFQTIGIQPSAALLVINSPEPFTYGNRVLEFVERGRLAALYPRREWIDAGGLIAYGVSFSALYRRAATYVDRILRGARPADLPVGQPSTFDLIINRAAARRLGICDPSSGVGSGNRSDRMM
jgi:putative ABC transport system substrate-binding protein